MRNFFLVKKIISRVSKFHKLVRYFFVANIEEDFNDLIAEFDGYMGSLNFSFMIQPRDESSKVKHEIRQIKELLFNVYGIPDNKQSLQNFLNRMDTVAIKNIEFQAQDKHISEYI